MTPPQVAHFQTLGFDRSSWGRRTTMADIRMYRGRPRQANSSERWNMPVGTASLDGILPTGLRDGAAPRAG